MFLPRTAEYGLRAMAQMASLGPNTIVKTKDLASQTRIPEPYLSKIMRRFVAAGLLDSINGPGGGFRFKLSMFLWRLWSGGYGQFSRPELTQLLARHGFVDISVTETLDGLGLLATASRPR